MSDLRSGAGIILMTVGAACGYGILHDLITTRVCLKYFTVFHPPIFGGTQDPTILALSWGIIATWWVGLPLGCLLALSARHGSWPKLDPRNLIPGLLCALAFMAANALIFGIIGYRYALTLLPDLAYSDPRFNADLFAHNASYFSGAAAGIILCAATILRRRRAYRSRTIPSVAPQKL